MEGIKLLRIAIVSDGPYGERAYETISKDFKTSFIEIESPSGVIVDELVIQPSFLEKITKFDLVITYITHPDLTQELVERIHDKVGWIIVGSWRGEGFRKQLIKFGNVSAPENMCDQEKNGNPVFDEFVSRFGRPEVKINCQGDIVTDIEVRRCSPCGATAFVAKELKGKSKKNLPINAGLKIQHYPCRAPKLRLFTDNECKKEMAANIHKKAFEKALKKRNNDFES